LPEWQTWRCLPMNQSTRLVAKTSEDLPADLVELTSLVADLPESHRSAVQQALNRVTDSTKRRRRILTLVQDALGQLRLDMKYLMFDLEATRRERDEYRRQSEET
ncbi:MAG TPA: transcriptional regulator, partial [Pirellulales bacterium]